MMSGMKNGGGQTNPTQSERLRFDRYRPGPCLSPAVSNYWVLQATTGTEVCRRQRIIPDGCVDLLFFRGGPTESFQAFVVGFMTGPIFKELTGPVEYLGIRFTPGGFGCFFRIPADELTDRIVPLDSIAAISTVATELAEAPNILSRLQILEKALSARRLVERPDPIMMRVLKTLTARQGMMTVEQLARTAGWSSRHLRRMVRASVGVGPKTFCEIIRFKTALRSLRERPRPDLLHVALDAGYYDQAHFIHDFNRFYGASPSTYCKDPAF